MRKELEEREMNLRYQVRSRRDPGRLKIFTRTIKGRTARGACRSADDHARTASRA